MGLEPCLAGSRALSALCVLWASAPARLLVLAQSDDDLPAGGSDAGAAATATVGEWMAVVTFLIVALVLSVMYAVRHKSDLGLDTLEHSALVTSWNTTPQRLLTIRCVIMVFMGSTVMFLIDPLHKGVAGVGDAFFCKFMPAVCVISLSVRASFSHFHLCVCAAGCGSQGLPTGATFC